jgi:hypothetical protein
MEMMNRAIEDASDFMEMKRKLMQTQESRFRELEQRGRHEMLDDLRKMEIAPAPIAARPIPPKRPGENRRDYRARVLSAQKVST